MSDGIQARDEALARVAENSGRWIDNAFEAFGKQSWPALVTGEDIRLALTSLRIVPHHHNAWGALTKKLINAGRLKPTNNFVNMRDKSSHARMTRQYEVASAASNV